MEQAINAYQKITATDEFKERERLRHYARLNEVTALRMKSGKSPEEIIREIEAK